VFNVGSDNEITINELADLVIEITGSKSEKRFVPLEKVYGLHFEESRRRLPDLTKIRHAIGYQPRISLEETIMRVIRHMEFDHGAAPFESLQDARHRMQVHPAISM
jgi:UDP-glucose 4-epimerase